MVSAVFDTSVLVSAFLTRHQPRGVSNELLRFVAEGKIELYLSADIITEDRFLLRRNGPRPFLLQCDIRIWVGRSRLGYFVKPCRPP